MKLRNSKSAPVGVIGKVLRILELLAQFPAGLELKEIAEKTGMNKSTLHRFLSHLETENYLVRNTKGAYMLGLKLARLGSEVNFHGALCQICRPTLETLRKRTSETVNLVVLDGSRILFLDVLPSPHTLRLVSEVGSHGAIHSTALGKAILAYMKDDQKREEILAAIRFEKDTPRTITSIARLKNDLMQIRKMGFSLDDEEAVVGVRCLGAPILGVDGEVAGAISVSGPLARVSKERVPSLSVEIRKAADEISWRLGHRVSKKPHKAAPHG